MALLVKNRKGLVLITKAETVLMQHFIVVHNRAGSYDILVNSPNDLRWHPYLMDVSGDEVEEWAHACVTKD